MEGKEKYKQNETIGLGRGIKGKKVGFINSKAWRRGGKRTKRRACKQTTQKVPSCT